MKMSTTPDKMQEFYKKHTFEIRKLKKPTRQRSSFQILTSMNLKGNPRNSNEDAIIRNSNFNKSLSVDEDAITGSQREITEQ